MLFLMIFFFLCSTCLCEAYNDTLKMVHLVYRHGARSPIIIYPNNIHKSFWLDGAGILTTIGMNMEYNLGNFLKKRYIEENKLLNTSYLHQEVYIRSSDEPRCLQSAQTQLSGMYPPKGRQVWNTAIPWQPIPVHTVPFNEDLYLRPDSPEICPRLQKIWDAKKSSKEYIQKEKEHAALLQLLSNYTGMAVNFDNLWVVNDDFDCEAPEKLPPPNWINSDQIAEMHQVSDWIFLNKYQGDEELGRLLGGTLLGVMIDNMNKFVGGKYDQLYKVNLFSGHDTSILSLATALDIDLLVSPPFSTCIMLELYNNSNGGYYVQIVYRNDTSKEPYLLKLKNCDVKCPLDLFFELLKNRIATESDRSKNCDNVTDGFFNKERLKVISIVFFVLTVVFLAMFIALFIRKHILRERRLDYYVKHGERESLINS